MKNEYFFTLHLHPRSDQIWGPRKTELRGNQGYGTLRNLVQPIVLDVNLFREYEKFEESVFYWHFNPLSGVLVGVKIIVDVSGHQGFWWELNIMNDLHECLQ